MESKLSEFKAFFNKYSEFFYVLILGVFCYLFLFLNLGAYPLIDIDETRYVQIAREMYASGNYITPHLNFNAFLEKPPLYFWATSFMFGLFHDYSNFVARFANALFACFIIFYTYFTARKVVNKKFGMICAVILLSSLWFLIFSHIAILDMSFCAMATAAVYSAMLTMHCKEENKKYFWWLFWIFMAYAVLAKGLIGIILPAGSVFFIMLAARNLKETVKPINIIPGILLFMLIAAPWHYFAWFQNRDFWVYEYIIKHHFARFVDSGMGLGRKQPFLFYVPVILLGIFPWIAQFVIMIYKILKHGYKEFSTTKSLRSIFSTDTLEHKILIFSSIWAAFIFLMFSISSTKLPTYVLPLFPPLAFICAHYWYDYIVADRYSKGARSSSYIFFSITFIIGAMALFLSCMCLKIFANYIWGADFILPAGICLVSVSIAGIIFALKNKRAALFGSYVVLSFCIVMIATLGVFEYMTKFGQSELTNYAQIAKHDKNSAIATYDFPHKYSVLETYGKYVRFIDSENLNNLKKYIEKNKKDGKTTYVIIKNVNFIHYKTFVKFKVVEVGRKYTLLKI